MSNKERIDVAINSIAKVSYFIDEIVKDPKGSAHHAINALNHLRIATAAMQSVEQSLLGHPEPKRG